MNKANEELKAKVESDFNRPDAVLAIIDRLPPEGLEGRLEALETTRNHHHERMNAMCRVEDDYLNRIRERLEALEKQPSTAGLRSDINDLYRMLSEHKAVLDRLSALEAKASDDDSWHAAALLDRIKEAEKRLEALEAKPEPEPVAEKPDHPPIPEWDSRFLYIGDKWTFRFPPYSCRSCLDECPEFSGPVAAWLWREKALYQTTHHDWSVATRNAVAWENWAAGRKW